MLHAFLSFSVVSLHVDCTSNKAFQMKPKLLRNFQPLFPTFSLWLDNPIGPRPPVRGSTTRHNILGKIPLDE
jgi:hypothetical protein